jgi:glucose-1-phosphate thymidylyltransferase
VKVVIPVAGIGTRLRPHTHTIPKALITVAGKPILGHILDAVLPLAPSEIVLVVGYMGERVVEYIDREHAGLPVRYAEQAERRGLGHAIYMCRGALDEEAPVLVILGDTIFEADLAAVVRGPHSSLGVMEVDDPRRFGVVVLENGFAKRLVEKPETPVSNLAIAGVYHFKNARLLAQCVAAVVEGGILTKGEHQLTDALQIMIDRGEAIGVFRLDGWYDCGKQETLLATNRYLLSRRATEARLDGSVVVPPVAVSAKARVERSVLGPYVSVAAGAVIRDSVVKDSIVNRNAVVDRSLLEASLVGENAVVQGAFRKLNVGDDSEVDLG